jgi:hypothetical protein
MDESSPLYQKTVRDGFEHIDERLDPWFKKAEVSVDLMIGPLEEAGFPANGVTVLRHFDPATGTIRVLDETASLDKIVHALRELHPVAASHSRLWTD